MPVDTLERTLWRRDGTRMAKIVARASRQGGVVVHLHEMGAQNHAEWGVDDREVSIELTPSGCAELVLALIEDRFGGRADALERFDEYCAERDIDGRRSDWT